MSDPSNNLDKNLCIVILEFMVFYWRSIILIVWPVISCVVFLLGSEEKFRCLFVVVLMSGFWVTECVPLYVTGMLPIVLFPILGVQDTGDVCISYMNKTNALCMASLLLAIGIEHCGLHKRIAYVTIIKMGCSPRRLHFGVVVVTMLLSMWIINTAATALMCPIITAILSELDTQGVGSMYKPRKPTDSDDEPPRPTNITLAYFLGAAYASSIGGIGCIIGTVTNLTFKGIYETRFPKGDKIGFVSWMLFNVPPMIVMGFFCWLSLEWIYMGLWRPNSEEAQIIKMGEANQDAAYSVMKTKMTELGPMLWNEICVLILFLICITLWFFRRPQFIPGWSDLYETEISDASPALMVIIFYAALPASIAFFDFCTKDKSARPIITSLPLVPWKVLQQKMPWGLLFLLGGGFALSSAGRVSGMSMYLGEKLSVINHLPSYFVLCITSFIACWVTELTANVAICNIVTPVLIEMSIAMKIHPIQYTYPAAVMCSMAFMLPVGTPANAVATQAANIRTIDMMRGGILLKLFVWALYMVVYPTYGSLFYEQGSMPDWVIDNSTSRTV